MPTTDTTTDYVLESVRRREERREREREEELILAGESVADVVANVCRRVDVCETFAQ